MNFVFYHDSNKTCVEIIILNDYLVEAPNETFYVYFSPVSLAQQVLFDQDRVTVSISDTDSMFLNQITTL